MTLRTLFDRFDLLMDTPESVPKLRRFILQSAVQGSLTRRDQDDTPADVLLEQIQQEKQRLYDAGEIRKPSTFEPVPESEQPHDIPSEWKWVRLGKVGNTQTGQTPKKSEDRFYGGRYPFLKPDNIENGEATYQGETLTEAGVQDGRVVPEESVLMVCIGTVGKAAVVNRKCSCNQQINYITPYGSLSSKYTLRAMQSTSFQKEAYQKSRSTTITILNKGNWETIPFPLPPPEEQQRIVKAVDGLMDECDALEEQQEREHALQVQVGTSATEALQSADGADALRSAWERVRGHFDTVTATPEGVDALRQTILQLAVQGRLTERDPDDTPADVLLEQIQQEKQQLYDAGEIRKPKTYGSVSQDETPFDIPENWSWAYLGRIGTWGAGATPKRGEAKYWDGGTIPWLKIGDLNNGRVFEAEEAVTQEALQECSLRENRPGDIAIAMYGASIGKLGYLEIDCVTNQAICVCTPMGATSGKYLFHFLKAAQGIFEDLGAGGAQPNISKTKIVNTPFPVPPPEEQQRLVERADRLLSFCDDLGDLITSSSERGEQLLKAALEKASADQQDTVATGMAA